MDDAQFQTKLQSLPAGEQYSVLLVNSNRITAIPDLTTYPQLSQLHVLNMANNALTEVKEEHIPASVTYMYLGHNNIHTISSRLARDWLHSSIELKKSEYRCVRLEPNPIGTYVCSIKCCNYNVIPLQHICVCNNVLLKYLIHVQSNDIIVFLIKLKLIQIHTLNN